MAYGESKWDVPDLSQAMVNAIFQNAHPRFLRQNDDLVKFNGFWRNGEKQNVCLWKNNASWHDAKTGQGGGCKEFAKAAFNMTLPDFMKRFGNLQSHRNSSTQIDLENTLKTAKIHSKKSVNLIWSEINNAAINNLHLATKWLADERGFKSASKFVGSGFTCLHENYIPYFEKAHHDFLRSRLRVGDQFMVPLRSTYSDEVKNIIFRTISPCEKDEKTRFLPEAGGWNEPDGSPRGFGFPHLIKNFPNLVLCEGMADYFAAECLLEDNEKYLPIGAANADALIKWATWLIANKYSGHTFIVYQLDKDKQGNLSKKTTGPLKGLQTLALLKKNGFRASPFDWLSYIKNITTHPQDIHDLADSLKAEAIHQECGPGHLPYLFLALLKHAGEA